jgi:homoserine dehydrogenase
MNFNLITFEGAAAGRQSLYGQGAGRYPTAYNVVQDLCDLLQGNGFYAPCEGTVAAKNDEELRFYVRGESDAWLESVTAEAWGEGIVTKSVTVDQMHAWLKEHPNAFMAAIR